jgi:hypothetical protein
MAYGKHDEATRIAMGALKRSLERRPWLAKTFFADLRLRNLFRPSGLVVPAALSFRVDYHRIHRAVSTTIRGLFALKTCRPLRHDYKVQVFPGSVARGANMEVVSGKHRVETFGDTVVHVVAVKQVDDPDVSEWLISYYHTVDFIGFTGPSDLLGAEVVVPTMPDGLSRHAFELPSALIPILSDPRALRQRVIRPNRLRRG